MAAQKGSGMLVKIESDTPSTFTTLGGIRDVSFRINNQTVDITNADSSGVMELLSTGGITSMEASGNGVFVDDASIEQARVKAASRENWGFQLVIPDWGTYEGPFQISSLEIGGRYDDAVTFTIDLRSAGEIAWTAA